MRDVMRGMDKQRAPVARVLDELCEAISEVDAAASSFMNAVGPILGEHFPVDAETAQKDPEDIQSMSEVYRSIRSETNRLKALSSQLRYNQRRVQV